MEKKYFVVLLYVFGIVPMMYEVYSMILPSLGLIGFGILNIITLMIFALLTGNKNTPQNKKKRIVTALVLLGIALVRWFTQLGSQATNWLHSKVFAPSQEEITTSGDITTGTNTTGEIPSIDLITGDIDITALTSWQKDPVPTYPESTIEEVKSNDIFWQEEVKPITTSTTPTTTQNNSFKESLPAKGTLNYAQVIPYLVASYNLKNTSNKNTTFNNISKSNDLYNPFNIAASKSMIGWDINPTSKLSCNTYLVLKGIAAGRKVEYSAGNPFSAYRKEAEKRWAVNGCTAGAFVTKATL